MNLRDAIEQVKICWMAGDTVTMESLPGIGKTEGTVGKLVPWVVARHPGKRVGLTMPMLALLSSVGLTGLPWKGVMNVNGKEYTVTDPAVPGWQMCMDVQTGEVLPADQFDVVILVLEEYGQGDPDTKKAATELYYRGVCGKWALPGAPGGPPGYNYRLALSNVDSRDGVTKKLDLVINRGKVLHVTPDVNVWIQDFADRGYEHNGKRWTVLPATKAWAEQHPTEACEDKPAVQGPWCTFRSLTMWDRHAQVAAELNGGKVPVDSPVFIEATNGMIGPRSSLSLIGHCRFALELPSKADIVADPQNTPIPRKGDLQALMAYSLAGTVEPDELGPVIQYLDRKIDGKNEFPKDMQVTFVSSLLRRSYVKFANEPPMVAWVAKNAAWLSLVQALAQ